MFLVTIGAISYGECIKEQIFSRFERIKNEGFEIIYENYNVDDNVFIRCGIKDNLLIRLTDKKIYEEFKYNIAQVVAEVIIDNWEPRLLKKIIKDNYFYLNHREKVSVNAIANRIVREEKTVQPVGFYKAVRKNKIMRVILEYLMNNDTMIIDGFVNFRLDSYLKELNEIIERSVELYIAEKEYNEFIKLLKYFVDIQECKEDTIHLQQSPDGNYLLLDSNKSRLNGEYFDEIRAEILDDSINYDDLLISTLITISPRKIFIHDIDSFKNRELVQTIRSVFADRVVICPGCELCGSAVVQNMETNNYGR